MSRLLFLLALAVVAYYFYRTLMRRRIRGTDRRATRTLDVVRCRHCGLLVEREQALTRAGRHYCSAEHMAHDETGST